MGRMKDLHIEFTNLEQSMIAIVEQILIAEGYQVSSRPEQARRLRGPDIVATPSDGSGHIAVEVKLYRSDRVSTGLLRNAFDQLDRYVLDTGAVAGILVVTTSLVPAQITRLRRPAREVWDLSDLTAKVKGNPALAAALFETIKSIQVGTLGSVSLPSELETLVDDDTQPEPRKEGEKLAMQLETSTAGRQGKAAQAFEQMCQKALELLYGRDFEGWKAQKAIEKGYQRLDLTARLVPVSRFWANLAGDFRTRYVIFEFKNYTKPITQDEVYTTEKYLFTDALRSVAIIIARKGDSPSAQRAMRGSLREQGKLILCISMPELCALLRGYDNGEDPTNLLYSRMDEMLITIAR
jgi:hypothetical protein